MKKILLVPSLVVLLLMVLSMGYALRERNSEAVAFMNEPRYELGEHKGAEFCGTCHAQVYAEWQTNSRHAISTTAESVRDVMRELGEHTILNFILRGEDMCYACHGPEVPNEGVNCETCHGPALPDTPIMVTHEEKFRPGRAGMQSEEFCANCHEIPGFVTPFSDWQSSVAAQAGVTCQACHMKADEGGKVYHGFDSFVIDETIYDGDVSLDDIRFDFPTLTLTITNHITGHSIPAGGPTRILALELSFRDAGGIELHTDTTTFAKHHSLVPVLGFWPAKIIGDTQLKSGESRRLSFAVPPDLRGRLGSVHLILRFYEVADEHEGNLEKAYYVSRPIIVQEIALEPTL
jgi:hypothetical protein